MSDKPSTRKNWFSRLIHPLLPEPKDRQELMGVLKDAEGRHILDADAIRMIEGVVEVSELQAHDIMIPRSQMITITQSATPNEILSVLIESQHSRFPVLNEDGSKVEGILLAKDLLRYAFGRQIEFDLKHVLRPAVFIPESKRLDILLREFRQTHNHMGIVVDEYGSIAGLVTMEDLLEQIVGNIEDESDTEEEDNILKTSEMIFTVRALTPVEEFNAYFQSSLDIEEFDTIGGLLLKAFGRLPKQGDKIILDTFEFEVMEADNRRVHLFRVVRQVHQKRDED